MRFKAFPTIVDDLDQLHYAASNCCGPDCCTPQKSEKLSISEDNEHFFVDAPLAGVKSDEVNVTIDPKKRSLLIQGEGKSERENVKYYLKGAQSYRYEIPLSNEIDLEGKVEAISRNGVLSVTLSKNKSHQPLKIDVKVE